MVSSVYVCFVIRKHDMFKTNQHTKNAEFSYRRGPHRVAVEECANTALVTYYLRLEARQSLCLFCKSKAELLLQVLLRC